MVPEAAVGGDGGWRRGGNGLRVLGCGDGGWLKPSPDNRNPLKRVGETGTRLSGFGIPALDFNPGRFADEPARYTPGAR